MNSNLHKDHKKSTKGHWREVGLILTSTEEFEEIYQRYITSTHCELCNKPYKSNKDRNMDHIHYIDKKWGWFRNVVCTSCNKLRSDNILQSNNKSGYAGIAKIIDSKNKQGFHYRFYAMVEKKFTQIKASTDYDKLVKFANQWKLDNNYNT